jgi:hypothetical protein
MQDSQNNAIFFLITIYFLGTVNFNKETSYRKLSEWAIFQLDYGENKLHFGDVHFVLDQHSFCVCFFFL